MPTIYKYMNALTVDQERYNVLITRPGYFAAPTPDPGDGTNPVGGVAQTDVRLAAKFPIPRAPKVVNHVTSMQSGHGWTASNALANAMNDGTDFVMGSQSAYITSKTDTGAATITKTLSPALDITSTKQLRILMKVTGGDYITQCLLYLTSDNFVANFSTINLQGPVADPNVRWFKDGEWTWITVNLGSTLATNNGSVTGSPNYAALDAIRIRLVSSSGNSATVRLQAVQVMEKKAFASGGIVCFTYDDSYRSQYTIARAHLDKYGWAGTAYTIDENVRKGDVGNALYLTTQQLKDLRRYNRWEIALHADTVSAHSRAMSGATSAQGTVYGANPLSATELNNDIDRNLKFLIDNDLIDGFVGHCHPQGRFSTDVNRRLARRVSYARAMTGNSNGMETVPPADPYAVRSYTLDNATTYTNLQTIIDGVATHGGMAVFTCHDIVASPTVSTEFSTTIHAQLVDYVATKTGVRVMTLGDVMRALSAQG